MDSPVRRGGAHPSDGRPRSQGARTRGSRRGRPQFGAIRPASRFTRFAKWTSRTAGHPAAFGAAAALIALWLMAGPLFGFTDTWQLIINTTTTIVTFLMVFLIQNTQNRDAEAIHIKLDELIKATRGAHNALLDLEELEQVDLDRIRDHYEHLAEDARGELRGSSEPKHRSQGDLERDSARRPRHG